MNCRTHRSLTPRTQIAVGSTLPTTSVSGSDIYQSRACIGVRVGRQSSLTVSSVVSSADPAGPRVRDVRVSCVSLHNALGAAVSWTGISNPQVVAARQWRKSARRPSRTSSSYACAYLCSRRAGDGRKSICPARARRPSRPSGAAQKKHIILPSRPEIGRGYPLNLSISLSGGKETNQDSLSNGE